jgi:hypothetical protein
VTDRDAGGTEGENGHGDENDRGHDDRDRALGG